MMMVSLPYPCATAHTQSLSLQAHNTKCGVSHICFTIVEYTNACRVFKLQIHTSMYFACLVGCLRSAQSADHQLTSLWRWQTRHPPLNQVALWVSSPPQPTRFVLWNFISRQVLLPLLTPVAHLSHETIGPCFFFFFFLLFSRTHFVTKIDIFFFLLVSKIRSVIVVRHHRHRYYYFIIGHVRGEQTFAFTIADPGCTPEETSEEKWKSRVTGVLTSAADTKRRQRRRLRRRRQTSRRQGEQGISQKSLWYCAIYCTNTLKTLSATTDHSLFTPHPPLASYIQYYS